MRFGNVPVYAVFSNTFHRSFSFFILAWVFVWTGIFFQADSRPNLGKTTAASKQKRETVVIPTYKKVVEGLHEPTDIQFFPGSSTRMLVLEKRGRIVEVEWKGKDPSSSEAVQTVRADFTGQVETRSEEGLLGLAFSPDFGKDSRVYVHVIVKENGKDYSKILEFEWKPETSLRLEDAKRTLVKLEQPYSNHNGGQIAFGPDRKLYIGFGDGGGRDDPFRNGQNPGTLLGKLLRIEPNSKSGGVSYKIPSDNPFVNRPGFLPEIWAYGLRNPWRFSFDSWNGDLYLADVGQDEYEEIDLIRKGGNYGWNIKEGFHCFRNHSDCKNSEIINPVYEYTHREGQSITGGFVYRGKRLPVLFGSYLYADFVTGKIWSLRLEGGKKVSHSLLFRVPFQISTFGQDASGEVYFADFGGGNIFQIIKKN
nr:PQQ-dependent sugar dehydrogenase [Leptospira gomenensis]